MPLTATEYSELRRLFDGYDVAADCRRAQGEYIEDLLAWMMLSDGKGQYGTLDTWWFDRAVPQMGDAEAYLSPAGRKILSFADRAGVPERDTPMFDDIVPEDIGAPLRRVRVEACGPEWTGGEAYNFLGLRELSRSERESFRRQGLLEGSPARMYCLFERVIDADGNWQDARTFFGWVPKLGCVPVLKRKAAQTLADYAHCLRIFLNGELCARYQWQVEVKTNHERTGILLPTNAYGAEALIHQRNTPEGRSRKAALRHWVNEHWRRLPSDAATETRVRAHLRGAERFRVGALHCRILPSTWDLERLQAQTSTRERRACSVDAP